MIRRFHRLRSPSLSKTLTTAITPPSVGIFWDLDNKPPNSIPPYDAAVRLHLAASSFGPLSLSLAFSNPHTLRHIPSSLLPPPSNLCRICGRNFRHRPSLLHHFQQIHQREQTKRLNRLSSARGVRRVRLASKLDLKIEKYKKVSREILIPNQGYGLVDELERAGVSVRVVGDRPESADRAMREAVVEGMDRRRFGCLVVVSDDSGFAGVLKEAKMRCLMTVVVGDEEDGALRRCADAVFSWRDVVSGKARKKAGREVGRWRDKGLLSGLEWRYDEDDDDDVLGDDGGGGGESLNLAGNEGNVPWWKLEESRDS